MTRPTPSSDVEKAQQAADAIGVTPNSNMRPFVVQAVLYALSRLSPPAQVEVTDEDADTRLMEFFVRELGGFSVDVVRHQRERLVGWKLNMSQRALLMRDVRQFVAALTATDAKPVTWTICERCQGSGYSNHPDSGETCRICDGQGGTRADA